MGQRPDQWLVGAAMRLYRRSPLYPSWGRRMAFLAGKLPGSSGVTQKEIGGVVLELDRSLVIDASLFYSGTFEEGTERAITACLSPGMVCIDVGANFGYHTFRMARAVGPQGSVLAVEPMSGARTRLLRNLSLNTFENIVVSSVALSDVESPTAEVSFEHSYRLDGTSDRDVEQVRVSTLDQLVKEHELRRVDFIKLDVDGFEGKVLRGARETLSTWAPALVFEISPGAMTTNGDSAQMLWRGLTDIGYVITFEDGTAIVDPHETLRRVGDDSINLLAVAARKGRDRPSA